MRNMIWMATACVLVIAACGGGSQEPTTSVVPAATSTTATPTTVADTTTTAGPVDTTTTVPSLTTTSAISETTTTAAPATTTTVPMIVELSDEGIQAGDTWVYFGFDDEDTIAAVSGVLGVPDTDSGWVDSFSGYGTCPGPDVRGVHWGALTLLFTHADTDFWSGGVPHFFAYYYTDIPPNLLTTEGIGLGSTIAQLEAAYGGTEFVLDEAWFDPTLGFWSFELAGWTGLSGYATGQGDLDTITSISGGIGCGE